MKKPAEKLPYDVRRLQIFGLLRKGASNKEMAYQLGLSEKTIKNYMSAFFDEFDVTNRVQLLLKITGFL